jgi:hypothetical protein
MSRFRQTLWALPAALLLAGCGGSDTISRSRALATTRRVATEQAREDQRACHEPLPRIVNLICEPGEKSWSCDFALSDGGRGSVALSAAGTFPIVTPIC